MPFPKIRPRSDFDEYSDSPRTLHAVDTGSSRSSGNPRFDLDDLAADVGPYEPGDGFSSYSGNGSGYSRPRQYGNSDHDSGHDSGYTRPPGLISGVNSITSMKSSRHQKYIPGDEPGHPGYLDRSAAINPEARRRQRYARQVNDPKRRRLFLFGFGLAIALVATAITVGITMSESPNTTGNGGLNDTLPTASPTELPVPTVSPTISPTAPTSSPSTGVPTTSPTKYPTSSPVTQAPTRSPTKLPTASPTQRPTMSPTQKPTVPQPTASPTIKPTKSPTRSPTKSPVTLAPSASPTVTGQPTQSPTKFPTVSPTNSPTRSPVSSAPTLSPTKSPVTSAPTTSPTKAPIMSANVRVRVQGVPSVATRVILLGSLPEFGEWDPCDPRVIETVKQGDEWIADVSMPFDTAAQYKAVYVNGECSAGTFEPGDNHPIGPYTQGGSNSDIVHFWGQPVSAVVEFRGTNIPIASFVYVTGLSPYLGAWSPCDGIEASLVGAQWVASKRLPKGNGYLYKFVYFSSPLNCNQPNWQPGGDRSFDILNGQDFTITSNWN